MNYFIRFVFLFSLFFHSLSFSQQPDFDSALKNYQSGDFASAKKLLDETLAHDANNALVLYNLGLIEYKLGNPGNALAYWRKALFISPQLGAAQDAVNYARSQIRLIQSEEVGTTSLVLNWIQEHVPGVLLYALCLLFAFLTLKYSIHYYALKKQAAHNDTLPPSFPFSILFNLALFLVLLYPVTMVLNSLRFEKATITSKSAEIKTGPNAENTTLHSLNEGEEVVVLDKNEDWYKIKDITGRLGWISKSSVFLTTVAP